MTDLTTEKRATAFYIILLTSREFCFSCSIVVFVECKEAVADIFFLLDESSSIKTVDNFKKELNFVTSVVDYLEIGLTKSQVGVMTFSDQPKIKFHLNDYTSKTAIANAISDIKWKGGNTFLDRALAMVRRRGLTPRYGSRPEVPQIAVIITDGVSTDPSKTRKELKKLHAQNYILYAIGILFFIIYS